MPGRRRKNRVSGEVGSGIDGSGFFKCKQRAAANTQIFVDYFSDERYRESEKAAPSAIGTMLQA